MSNYYFDVTLKAQVAIPLDQVCDKNGNEISEKHSYSKEEIKSFLKDEIIFSMHNAISDGNYAVEIDESELSLAANLFFTNDIK